MCLGGCAAQQAAASKQASPVAPHQNPLRCPPPRLPMPQEEKARTEALVQRMSGLLACFPFQGKAGKAGAKGAAAEVAVPSKPPPPSLYEMDEALGRWGWVCEKGPHGRGRAQGSSEELSRRGCPRWVLSLPGLGSLCLSPPHAQASNPRHRTATPLRAGRMEVIEAVRRTLNSMDIKQSDVGTIETLAAIGEGTVGGGVADACTSHCCAQSWLGQGRKRVRFAGIPAFMQGVVLWLIRASFIPLLCSTARCTAGCGRAPRWPSRRSCCRWVGLAAWALRALSFLRSTQLAPSSLWARGSRMRTNKRMLPPFPTLCRRRPT